MPEVRLIDGAALAWYFCGACANKAFCAEESCHYYDIRRRIKSAPTIEAEPVRHGRWNEKGHCECCGYDMGSRVNKWTNVYDLQFCPNCGARMDGGDDNG